ncbi:MAG TPA: DUF5677 domain-containing protein [Rhizomicrobium sp.]|jgi:hypothetical protein
MDRVTKRIHEATKELPRRFLEKKVAEKIREAGVDDAKTIAPKLLEHFLSGSTEPFVWDDGRDTPSPNIAISLKDEDLDDALRKASAFIANDLPKVLKDTADQGAKNVLATLKKRWPAQAQWEDDTMTVFRYNLEVRWGRALDLLRMLLTLAREAGDTRLKRYKRLKTHKQPQLWGVLFRLHARSCQVAGEIVTLLENGLADGAMARWRTLYEIGVVATLLADHGEDIANRYVAHEVVEAKSAMDEYERSQVPLGRPPYAKRERARILNGYAKAIDLYGKEFASTYGWAAHHLKRKKPIFPDLEAAADRAQMRSYYKMASYNVHASPKGIFFRHSTLEPTMNIIAGASNVGLSEPGQNTAFTLTLITGLLYGPRYTFVDVISLKAMIALRNEIPGAFVRA